MAALKVFAHLVVRGGGSTFYRKNLYRLSGLPVVGHAIALCQATGLVDEIFVWSEDAEVQDISRSMGAHALERPREMVHYFSGFHNLDEWGANRFGQVEKLMGTPGDIHLSLNCNNFMVRPETLRAMFRKLEENPTAMRVTAMRRVAPGLCLVNPGTSYLFPFWNDLHTPAERTPGLFRLVGASFSSRPRQMAGVTGSLHHEVDEEEGFDFQTEEDVPLAEFYLARRAAAGREERA
jgi:hypothetical protein